jgi:hypothetical protein
LGEHQAICHPHTHTQRTNHSVWVEGFNWQGLHVFVDGDSYRIDQCRGLTKDAKDIVGLKSTIDH